jgi:hypothetical protein
MFDLEQAILQWRQQMLAAGIQSPVPLEELESHLRDELEQQMKSGLEPKAALAVAIEKVGQAQNLKAEFIKVRPIKWSVNLVATILFSLVGVVFVISLMTHDLYRHEMNWTWRLFGFANIGLYIAIMMGCAFMTKYFPIIPNRIKRSAIEISFFVGGIGMAILMDYLVPHFGLAEGEQWMLTKWATTFLTACTLVSFALERAAKRATLVTDQ